MGKRRGNGSYLGGHTVLGPNSDWFTRRGKRRRRKVWTLEELAKSAIDSANRAEKERQRVEAEFKKLQKTKRSNIRRRGKRRRR